MQEFQFFFQFQVECILSYSLFESLTRAVAVPTLAVNINFEDH